MKILLIDDCRDMGELVKRGLEPHEVNQALSLHDARLEINAGTFDVALIDVNLPDGSGLDFCIEIAKNPLYGHMVKLMLTGDIHPSTVVSALSCGAEDFIRKPFLMEELKARVDLRLKGHKLSQTTSVAFNQFEFDYKFQSCFRVSTTGKTDLALTPTEFRIFLTLIRQANNPVSRRELLSSIWKSHGVHIESKSIDSHIAHLRRKVGEEGKNIVTVYGSGYAYVTSPQID
ncbi:MAG: hypothetical protein C5B49_06690 [Bdellovibrio sp.]|nr:MAG: hypothetical protein C5B49_06690 [Bdellovibrio sp.]